MSSKGNYSNGKFIATDHASLALSTTIVDGGGSGHFDSIVVPVWDVKKLVIQGKTTGGNASAVSDVIFILAGRIGEAGLWDTVAAFTLTLTQNGTTQVVESGQIDVQGFHDIKLLSIENEDSSYTATILNVFWGKAYGVGNW